MLETVRAWIGQFAKPLGLLPSSAPSPQSRAFDVQLLKMEAEQQAIELRLRLLESGNDPRGRRS